MAALQQWPAAIEALSDIINHSTGETRKASIIARINSLISAGEHFLALIESRGWAKFTDDPKFRKELTDILLREASVASAEHVREKYYAVAAMQHDSIENTVRLANELVNNGRYRFALMTLPSLEPNRVTEDIVLRCCYQLGWWNLFDDTIANASDHGKRDLWLGLKQLRLGDYRNAHESMKTSGEYGTAWLKHWEQGHLIYTRLTNSNEATRIAAAKEWQAWHTQNPGPKQWIAEPMTVKKSLGAAAVHAKVANTTAQYFLAKPDQPGSISITGPCRIKVEARPLHTADGDVPLNDWLVISNEAMTETIPILNNYPSELLQIRGVQLEKVGGMVATEITLPEGVNFLDVSAEKSPLLFRVMVERPEIALSVLPQVNETTIRAINQGEFGNTTPCCENSERFTRDCIRLVNVDCSCRSVTRKLNRCECVCFENQTQRIETAQFSDSSMGSLLNENGIQVFKGFQVDIMDPVLRSAVLAAKESENDGSLNNDQRLKSLVQLHQLVQENPARKDIKRIYNQVKSGFTWERFEQFDSQAGIHTVDYTGWLPESAALRIRKCMMGDWTWDYVLAGTNDLDLQVDGSLPSQFRVAMQRPRVSFLSVAPTTVSYQAESTLGQVLLNDPGEVVEIQADLSSGAQQLKLRQLNPLANHFVGLNIQEILPEGEIVPISQVTDQVKERGYQVGLHDEPLRFKVGGPTIIRIDRLNEDLRFGRSETIVVAESEKEFSLTPGDGEEMGFFRVFEMVAGNPPSPIHHVEAIAPEVEDQWVDDVVDSVFQQVSYFDESLPMDTLSLRSPNAEPASVELNDYQELGLQEMGTWVASVGYQERNPLDEFPRDIASNKYLEAKVARHYYDPWKDRYTFDQLLVRPHIEAGTTFGFLHQGSTKLDFNKCKADVKANGWSPFRLNWNAYGLVQNAGTPLRNSSSNNPWIVGGTTGISRRQVINEHWSHTPALVLFGRVLSEERDGFEAGELDQDVFTRYKRNHRFGLRLSDKIVVQKCLDKRCWIRPYLATNEDQLTPDNLGFQVGTDQLMGPLQLKLAYRLTGYLSDNDRIHTSVQNVVQVGAIYERWHNQVRRSELRFDIQHDVDDDTGTSFSFNLVSFFNHGRGYRDIDPSRMLFKSIKRQRAAKHYLLD